MEVARTLGVDQSVVSRWRSGDRVPDADQLATMLRLVEAPGLGDYVLGLTALNPVEVRRLRADVARLLDAAERGPKKSR